MDIIATDQPTTDAEREETVLTSVGNPRRVRL